MKKKQSDQKNSYSQKRATNRQMRMAEKLSSGPEGRFGKCFDLANGGFSGDLPICLFGSGAGYYRPWPGEDFQPGQLRKVIGQSLRRIWSLARLSKCPRTRPTQQATGLAAANLQVQMAKDLRAKHMGVLQKDLPRNLRSFGPGQIEQNVSINELFRKQIHERDAQTTRYPASNPRFSVQPWLFPDYAGAGRPSGRQQSYRVSTHRSPRRKGTYSKVQTQGTLFVFDK